MRKFFFLAILTLLSVVCFGQDGGVIKFLGIPIDGPEADFILFCQDHEEGLSVLLIERGGEPYKGCWAFPGGFLEMDETVEEGAVRELQEETGLILSPDDGRLKQLGCYSKVDRDPRGRVITIAFYAVVDKAEVKGSDDARDARWFPVSALPPLAFDHDVVLRDALRRLETDSHMH